MKNKDTRCTFLRNLVKKAGPEYSARKEAAEKQVVRWEYYTREAREPMPYLAERLELKRGDCLKGPSGRAYAYGLDRSGNVVVVRTPKTREEPPLEEFRESKGNVIGIIYEVHAQHSAYGATLQKWRRGKLISCDLLDHDGAFLENYSYKKDHLDQIETVGISPDETVNFRFRIRR